MHVHVKPIDVAFARVEANESILQLAALCPGCRKAARILDGWLLLADHPDPLVAAQIEMGHVRLERLLSVPLKQGREVVETNPEYQVWGLARLAILAAIRTATHGHDSERAFHLATLALDVTARLDPEIYGAAHFLRINYQAVEAGLRVLASSLDQKDLELVLEASLLHLQTLVDSLATPYRSGPSDG